MYERFYGLKELPFAQLSNSDCLYLSESHKHVLEKLERVVHERSGFCVVSGDAGVGKTTLVTALIKQLDGFVYAGFLDAGDTGTDGITESAAAALGLEVSDDDAEGNINQALANYITGLEQDGKRALLIIEEAHRLAPSNFDELAALPGVAAQTLQLVLVGQAELEQCLQQPALADFAERVAIQCPLSAFSLIETDAYIRHRVTLAGGSAGLFTPSASEVVHRYSQGIAGMINRVCDLSLVYGYARKISNIDESVLNLVLNDRWGGSLLNSASDDRKPAEPESAAAVRQAAPLAHTEPQQAEPEPAAAAATAQAAGSMQAPADEQHAVAETEQPLAEELEAESIPSQVQTTEEQKAAEPLLSEQQILEILGMEKQKQQKSRPAENRDMADFIRLSLQYHRQHTDRVTFGVLGGVLVLAALTLWAVIGFDSEDAVQPVMAAQHAEIESSLVDISALEQSPARESRAVESLPPAVTIEQRVETIEQAAPPASVVPVADMVEPEPEQQQEEVAVVTPAEDIESITRELEAQRKQLEAEKRRVQRQLEAQRAERDRLKKETRRERQRAEKAQLLVEEAKKSARMAWDRLHEATPEAFPDGD
jgi:type II secretory pathway predicted ATPase ExeA